MNLTETDDRIQLVDVACDLCGSHGADPLLRLSDVINGTAGGTFPLVRCRACGHRYLNPRPSDDSLPSLYAGDYAPFSQSGLSARIKRVQRRRLIRRYWSILGPSARVLDLGCATGETLAAVKALGNSNVVGVEPSEQAAAIARRRYRLDVRIGTLEDAGLPKGSIDVVLMSHAIEHLPSPSQTIAEIARVTSDQAHLLLWLPNVDSWAATVFRRNWIGYDAPRHLHDFSVPTLSGLLARHGFVVAAIEHEAVGLEWSWGLRLMARERFGRGRLDRWLERLHPLLTGLATPISWTAARRGHSGRIFVMARKCENHYSDADLD